MESFLSDVFHVILSLLAFSVKNKYVTSWYNYTMKPSYEIKKAISLIESRLSEPINVEELAGLSYFSKTHFQRLFNETVGEPVMEYVKKRRLQQAGEALLVTNESVLSIALQYGYHSHEGFTRAFKAYFGEPPNKYRRRRSQTAAYTHSQLKKEDITMYNKINQKMTILSQELTNLEQGMRQLAAEMEAEANKIAPRGAAVLVLTGELFSFAGRVAQVSDEVKAIASPEGEKQNVFDLFEKLYTPVKMVADMAFQLNLLRFFGGIEAARLKGDASVTFAAFAQRLDETFRHVGFTKEGFDMLNELMALLQNEIKQEALGHLRAAQEDLGKAAAEGDAIAQAADALTDVFGLFGQEVIKHAVNPVRQVSALLEALTANLQQAQAGKPYTLDYEPLQSGVKILQGAAFHMNVNAFNAAIETARQGGDKPLLTCAERIRDYAWLLVQAAQAYKKHLDESAQAALVFAQASPSVGTDKTKQIDDLHFQGNIITKQFALEAERAGHDGFAALAKQAQADLDSVLTFDLPSLQAYGVRVTALINRLSAEADNAPDIAPPFAYIAKEYRHLAERIAAV
jgi:AraC family transcriptional regulator